MITDTSTFVQSCIDEDTFDDAHDVIARTEVVPVDGVDIVTYRLRPRSQPPRGDVVICHGTPWSAGMWMPLAIHIGRSHRVFLWDMPGYGKSILPAPSSGSRNSAPSSDSRNISPSSDSRDISTSGPSQLPTHSASAAETPPLGLLTQSSRLATLVRHWGLQQPMVIAHDIGGAVALGAHLREDVDFTSMYLLDIVTLTPWGSPFFRLVSDNEAVFAALPPELHAALVRTYIAGAGGPRLSKEWIEKLSEPWLAQDGQEAFYRQIASLKEEDTRQIVAQLDQVRCRVHIGWGENDPWIPQVQADQLHRLIPDTDEIT